MSAVFVFPVVSVWVHVEKQDNKQDGTVNILHKSDEWMKKFVFGRQKVKHTGLFCRNKTKACFLKAVYRTIPSFELILPVDKMFSLFWPAASLGH